MTEILLKDIKDLSLNNNSSLDMSNEPSSNTMVSLDSTNVIDLSSSLVNPNIVEQIETQNLTSSTQSLSIDLS
jgi:hypothetical protein